MSPYRTAATRLVASKPKKASWLSLLLWRFLSNGHRRLKASKLRRKGKLVDAQIVLNKRWDNLGVIDYMKVLALWEREKVPGLRPDFEDYLNSHLRSGCARSSPRVFRAFHQASEMLRLQQDLQDIQQDVRKLKQGHLNAVDMIMAHMKDHFGGE